MKPGLYVATVRGVENTLVMAHDDGDWFCTPERVKRTDHHPAAFVTDARPLVVLDPESGEDCHRLADALNDMDGAPAWLTQGAATLLRALADPKPAEPTGLGAVVLDSVGRHWVRANSWDLPWVCQAGAMEPDEYIDERKWTDLDVVEVLSEGWSE